MKLGLLLPLLGLAACSGDDGGSTGDLGSAGEGGGGGAPSCEGPGYGEAWEPQHVSSLSATLVDENGDPVANEEVQLCGTDVCIARKSGASGGVAIPVNGPVRKPAFKYGLGIVSARFAWRIPEEEEVDLGTVHTVRLPELGLGEALAPGASASFDGFTLSLAPNTEIAFDNITFRTPEEKLLRAVLVPPEARPAVLDDSLGFGLVYAATPNETRFCPPAALSVDNSEGWPPGAEVEVWLHGIDISEEYAPYAGFAKVSDARVSDDGARIETTEPGLPILGVLGFKLK